MEALLLLKVFFNVIDEKLLCHKSTKALNPTIIDLIKIYSTLCLFVIWCFIGIFKFATFLDWTHYYYEKKSNIEKENYHRINFMIR
jgi:hypothetical protein